MKDICLARESMVPVSPVKPSFLFSTFCFLPQDNKSFAVVCLPNFRFDSLLRRTFIFTFPSPSVAFPGFPISVALIFLVRFCPLSFRLLSPLPWSTNFHPASSSDLEQHSIVVSGRSFISRSSNINPIC
jgi:hypothetical protein